MQTSFTAALRELDSRLDRLIGFLAVELSKLESTYPQKITISASADADGAVSFNGYVMSDNTYEKCILIGRFRSKAADMVYAFSSGKIEKFMNKYNEDNVRVTRNASAITVTSDKCSLVFANKSTKLGGLLDFFRGSKDVLMVDKILQDVKARYAAGYKTVRNIHSNHAWAIWSTTNPAQEIQFYVKDFNLYSITNQQFMDVPETDTYLHNYADTLVRCINNTVWTYSFTAWGVINLRHIG